jgi:hypothetical protein
VIKSVAPAIGRTSASAGPAMITLLPISGKFWKLIPVLESIRVASRTFTNLPAFRGTRTTPRSVPPSCVKFVILRKRPSGTVIVSGEVVMTLLLNAPAKTKPGFRRKKTANHQLRCILFVICSDAVSPTIIRRQLLVYFCLHRGKCNVKGSRMANLFKAA